MRNLFKWILFFTISLIFAQNGYSKPYVVVSTADMASITKYLAGDLIEMKIIFNGSGDIHFFQPRPQHIVWCKKADLLIATGMDLDEWIYPLLKSSRNPRIQIGEIGFIDPSAGVSALNVPQGKFDGSQGHIHKWGNPHFWFTEKNIIIAARNINDGLVKFIPDKKDILNKRLDDFIKETKSVFADLNVKMAPFKDTRIIQYHESWDYFAEQFGLIIAGNIEPKPGIPPAPKHIAELKQIIETENVKLILAEPYYPSQPIEKLTEQTAVKPVRISLYSKKSEFILDHIKFQVESIVDTLKK